MMYGSELESSPHIYASLFMIFLVFGSPISADLV